MTGRPVLAGETLAGRFRVDGLVGEGGMGWVYDAEDLIGGGRVAIKVLRPELAHDDTSLARFRREVRVVGALGHPHICASVDSGTTDDGLPFLATELVRGSSLRPVIADQAPLSQRRALAIVAQVLDGLGAAHRVGVIHRDLKPENVLLEARADGDEHVRLVDFGISKILPSEGVPASVLTRTGVAMGTAAYMAPEQARAERDLDARVDVYACGVLLYEMLTARLPFGGDSGQAVLLAILFDPYLPPRALRPRLSRDVDRVVTTALTRQRDGRFADASSMRAAVLAARRKIGESEGG